MNLYFPLFVPKRSQSESNTVVVVIAVEEVKTESQDISFQ